MSQVQVHRSFGVEPASQAAAASGADYSDGYDVPGSTLRHLRASIRRQALWVAAFTAAGIAVTTYFVLSAPTVYSAHAVLRVKDGNSELGARLADNVPGISPRGTDPLLSQLQVLLSRGVARRVVRQTPLRLEAINDSRRTRAVPSFTHIRIESTEASSDTVRFAFRPTGIEATRGNERVKSSYGDTLRLGDLSLVIAKKPDTDAESFVMISEEEAIDKLLSRLSATPRQKTDVIDLRYSSSDPVLAQVVVNATALEYQSLSSSTAKDESRRRSEFLRGQLFEVDSMQRAAQAALSVFRSRERVYSSQERFSTEQANLTGLELRRAELRAQVSMYQRLLSEVDRGGQRSRDALRALVATPVAVNNPTVVSTYDQLRQYEMRLDSLTSGPWASAESNPDVRRLRVLKDSAGSRLVAALQSNLNLLKAQMGALDDVKQQTETQIAKLPEAEAEELRLVQRMESVRRMAEQLQEEYQRARVAEAVEAGQAEIVDFAAVPTTPVSADPRIKWIAGALLSLALGLAAGLGIDQLNTSIRSREEMEQSLRLPELAAIPSIRRRRTLGNSLFARRSGLSQASNASEVLAAARPNNAAAEAYKSLRTNVMFSRQSTRLRSLIVTSSQPGEGKSTTAANLALTYAHQGLRVLLVDADLRRPTLHRLFGLRQTPGLSEVLVGLSAGSEASVKTNTPNLDLLPSGTCPPNPAELLGSGAMGEVIRDLRERYDVLIIDTPPVLAAADATVLATIVDGTIVVVRAGYTEREAAQAAVRQLFAVGASIVGGVLNDPDSRLTGPREYGYYQGYYADPNAQGQS